MSGSERTPPQTSAERQPPQMSPGREPHQVSEVTRLLSAIEAGDPSAAEQLLPLVYQELRRLAAQRVSLEKPGQTLQATALVHEAYLRLVGPDPDRLMEWPKPLLRRGGSSHAAHPGRGRPSEVP